MVHPPQETSTIEGEVIKNGLHVPRSVSRVIMADKTYRFFTLKEYVRALKRVRKGTYQSEIYDCDDFARYAVSSVKSDPHRPKLHGAAIGVTFGRYSPYREYHAIVVFWTAPDKRYYWEPQTHKIVTFHPDQIFL